MLNFKNHRGEYNKANIGLASSAAISVIAAIATISMPYWGLATTSILAATPLGIGVLAGFAVLFAALAGLAVYAINRNNKISEMEGPKIISCGMLGSRGIIGNDCAVYLCLTQKDYEYIKQNHFISGERRINFTNPEGEACYLIYKHFDGLSIFSNTLYLEIDSLGVKDKNGKDKVLKDTKEQLSALGLGIRRNGKKEISITFAPSPTVEAPQVQQKEPSQVKMANT